MSSYYPHLGALDTIHRTRIPYTGATHRMHRGEKVEPWGSIERAILDSAPQGILQHYPDFDPFYDRLASFIGQPRERIVVGAGIEEFVRTLFMVGTRRDERAVVLAPTWRMYQVYAQALYVPLENLPLAIGQPENMTSLLDALDRASDGQKLRVFLPNPNQPFEHALDLKGLAVLADYLHKGNSTLVVDEAYHGFGADSALPLVGSYDNVLVLRSFSKAFGLAGCRIGYAVGQEPMLYPLRALRLSNEVTGLAMHAATYLMNNWDTVVVPSIARVVEGRDWLRREAEVRGFKAWGSYANRVIIELPHYLDGGEVVRVMASESVAVQTIPLGDARRSVGLLITCGTARTCRIVLDLLTLARDASRTAAIGSGSMADQP